MPDSLGFSAATLALPEQVLAASRSLQVTGALPGHDEIANVVILGTGTSGWVGNLVNAVAGPFMPVPLVVATGYAPPSFVDGSTLVVAISPSGDAPETVAAATICVEEGAKLFAVTSGGALGALADRAEAPTVFLPTADGDVHPPVRTRIGALVVPVLKAFDSLGLFPGARDWIAAAADQLRTRRDELSGPQNMATDLARTIAGTMPVIYGGGSLGAVAAGRWKDQINLNAKSPAWAGSLPEVIHGEMAGWGQHGDITRQIHSLILLRHDEEPAEGADQFAQVEEWMDEVVADIHTVHAGGEGRLAQVLDLCLIGDVVSIELARRFGIDPGPTPVLPSAEP